MPVDWDGTTEKLRIVHLLALEERIFKLIIIITEVILILSRLSVGPYLRLCSLNDLHKTNKIFRLVNF